MNDELPTNLLEQTFNNATKEIQKLVNERNSGRAYVEVLIRKQLYDKIEKELKEVVIQRNPEITQYITDIINEITRNIQTCLISIPFDKEIYTQCPRCYETIQNNLKNCPKCGICLSCNL